MKDAPAFDFYPERFWFAVEGWTEQEICRYWRLLGQQWMRGSLPADEKELAGLARGKVTHRLLLKFPVSPEGGRVNIFMEQLRQAQRERIEKSREKGRKMAEGRWSKNDSKQCISNAQALLTASTKQCLDHAHHSPLTTHPREEDKSSSILCQVAPDGKDAAKRILAYLNEVTGRSFRLTDTHRTLILARLKESEVTEDGIRLMIERMAAKWKGDPKMEEYLRPTTLFGKEKFGAYYDDRAEPVFDATGNMIFGTTAAATPSAPQAEIFDEEAEAQREAWRKAVAADDARKASTDEFEYFDDDAA